VNTFAPDSSVHELHSAEEEKRIPEGGADKCRQEEMPPWHAACPSGDGDQVADHRDEAAEENGNGAAVPLEEFFGDLQIVLVEQKIFPHAEDQWSSAVVTHEIRDEGTEDRPEARDSYG